MDHAGFISLVPALATLALALIFRKTFEALLGGCAIGFLLIESRRWWGSEDYEGFLPLVAFGRFVSALEEVMADPVVGWIILVVGLFGSLIALLAKSGGSLAFGRLLAKYVSTRRGAMFSAWALGLAIFIDDYLNALTVGTTMRRLADRFRVSREMLAYIVDSTSAPVCVLVPFSTWAIFTAGLLEDNGVAATGGGLVAYMAIAPFMFYAIIALLMVPLVILGVIPPMGPMRTAEAAAASLEAPAPVAASGVQVLDEELDSAIPAEKARLLNFVLPIVVLIFWTWYSGVNALQGVMAAIIVTSVLYLAQRLTTIEEFSATFFRGFATMLMPLGIVISSFVLVKINEELGLTTYVIETARELMSPALMPAVVFLTMGFVAFATGSFWGMFAVSLPIVIPLANELGVSQPLAIGAVISAGAFGSHLCPFGDSTVLSSSGSGCDNMRHVQTQMPYGFLAAFLSVIAYLIAGSLLTGGQP
jgi:Na+/H+ antiporter NhaC